MSFGFKLIANHCIVNELSTTINLESTLVRAEALFRRFQRTVEAIDKKSNFPAPNIRLRQPARNGSTRSVQSSTSPLPTSQDSNAGYETSAANTSAISAVTAGSTNSGTIDKGKRHVDKANGEMLDRRPKVISPELRGLMSRKVEILSRRIVRKEGEGLSSLGK